MKLVELRKENIEEFKKLMQDAFQYGYESIYYILIQKYGKFVHHILIKEISTSM